MAQKPTSHYDESHIQVLEGLDPVRKRPGMYIGGTGADGLHHLVWELIDNAVDEAAAGFANLITITLHRDSSIEVEDNGRGIPIGMKDNGRTALEVVFTELHAGGKFGSGAYSASGGLHGVGASVVNALARQLVAEVDLNGFTHRLCFVNQAPGQIGPKGGFTKGSKLEQVRKIPQNRTGTRVRFWPDMDIFDPDASIDYQRIRDHARQVSFLVPGLKVVLVDRRGSQPADPEEFVAKGGLADYVDLLSIGEPVTDIVVLHGESTFVEKVPVDGQITDVERTCGVDIALRWVRGYDSRIVSFVNTIPTTAGGTHVAGFDRALTKAANDTLLVGVKKLAKLAKAGKDRAEKGDVQEGLVAAIKVTVPEPQFKGQTKQELGTPGVQSIVYEITKDGMVHWIESAAKRTNVSALREKLATAILNRVAAKQTLDARRKAASLGSSGLPGKLADCRVHGPEAELLIVEGDSAAGPAKAGRDARNMAVLPLRGKVVNAGKATLKQVVENAEAQALFTAIGAGSGRDFRIEDARYGRVIILCDADVDGSHIRCLLLTLIYHYMRPMLSAGMIYAAQPPLYSIKIGDEVRYAFDEAERDRLTTELVAKGRKLENLQWVRFKGLGEMDVDELVETCLDPSSRILRRITMDEAEDAEEALAAADMFEVLMGSDVGRRKQFLLDNSDLVDPTLLDV